MEREWIAAGLFIAAVVTMMIERPVGLFVLGCAAVAMPRVSRYD